jgi:hypothetical protein
MSVNQTSEKQRAASRANGAKSKGPVSVEGRARSSRNSLRHGFCSSVVVLPHEDQAHFEQLRDSYIDDFQPANQSQFDLVETMAAAQWRLNRFLEMEATIFEKEMLLCRKDMVKVFKNMTKEEELAWTFDHMANQTKSLQTLTRYESQLNRSYDRAFKHLKELQAQHRNEPGPELTIAPARHTEPKLEPEKCESNPAEPPIDESAPPSTLETTPGEPPDPEKES